MYLWWHSVLLITSYHTYFTKIYFKHCFFFVLTSPYDSVFLEISGFAIIRAGQDYIVDKIQCVIAALVLWPCSLLVEFFVSIRKVKTWDKILLLQNLILTFCLWFCSLLLVTQTFPSSRLLKLSLKLCGRPLTITILF